jgi:hypothetical protein
MLHALRVPGVYDQHRRTQLSHPCNDAGVALGVTEAFEISGDMLTGHRAAGLTAGLRRPCARRNTNHRR